MPNRTEDSSTWAMHILVAVRERNDESLFFRQLDLSGAPRAAAAASQRARMLDAMTRAVAHKGYTAVTVGDVVAAAGVSRRTFYEYFADKETCFLEAYATGAQVVIEDIHQAVRDSGETDWERRVRVGIEAYLDILAAEPDLAETLLVHFVGAGPRAVAMRREVFDAFAELYRPGRDANVTLAAMPDVFRRGLVGGIDSLVQQQIADHGAENVTDLGPSLVELALAVIGASVAVGAGD